MIVIPALVFLFTLFSFSSFSLAENRKIYFCHVGRSANQMAPFVAKKKGFFRQEGLDVELIQAGGNICIAGVVSKNVDYTHVFGSVVRAAIKGLPIRAVMSSSDSPDYGLVVRAGIKNFTDLRGKTLAVSRAGGGADVTARLILEKNGLIPDKDVKILPVGSSDEARVAALEQSLVDGITVNIVQALILEKKGYKILAWAVDEVEFPFNCVCTSTDKIRDQPDEVKKVILSFLRAIKLIREDREQAVSLMMEWSKINKETAEQSYPIVARNFSTTGEPKSEGMKVVLRQAQKEMQLTEDVPLSKVADFSLLKSVQKELGLSRMP